MGRRIVFVLAALAAGTAAAQEARQPDPTSPQAKVPPAEYRSAFEGYRPLTEDKVAPWRESNEAVKESGHDEKPAAQKPPAAGHEHGGHE
jgi:hypothetical protein